MIDTTTFLWWMSNPGAVSLKVLPLLVDRRNEVLLSVASAWEVACKRQLGRLALPEDTASFMTEAIGNHAVTVLPLTTAHALRAGEMPLYHEDPFDRLIAAQVQVEGLVLASANPVFDRYGLDRLW